VEERAALPGEGEAVPAPAGGRALGRTFWWLWAGNLLSALAMFVVPFLAMYLASRGLRPSRVGLVMACYSLGALVAGPAAGALADAIGRRRTLIAALLGAAASAAALAFLRDPLAVAAGVLCFGASAAGSRAPMRAIVGDVVAPAELPRAFGWLYWAENVGAGVSMAAGGLLAAGGWTLPFLVDAGTTLGYAAVALLRVPETAPGATGGAERGGGSAGYGLVLRDRKLVALLGLVLLVDLVYMQMWVSLPVDMGLRGFTARDYGFVGAASSALVVALQPFSARALRGLSPARTLALGALLIALGVGGYALCSSLPGLVAATAVWTLGEIAFFSTASAAVAALAPPEARGRTMGAYTLCFSIGGIVAPAAGPAVLEALGARALWSACLVLGVGAAAGLLRWGRAGRAGALGDTGAAA
jgi:MFS family permease